MMRFNFKKNKRIFTRDSGKILGSILTIYV